MSHPPGCKVFVCVWEGGGSGRVKPLLIETSTKFRRNRVLNRKSCHVKSAPSPSPLSLPFHRRG